MRRVTVTGMFVVLMTLVCGRLAWAQFVRQPPAELSAVDVVASVFGKQVPPTSGAQVRWSGPGFSLAVDGNVTRNVAVAAGVERFTQGGLAWLAGLQLSTAFEYGSGRDPVPGRYFAKFLAGVSSGGSVQTRGIGQIDVGADILTTLRPLGVRFEAGYDIVPGDPIHHAYGRVAIGFIFGPRI
jgi:hypothetical protein